MTKKGKPKKPGVPKELQTHYLDLLESGQVSTSKFMFWTDDVLVDSRMGEARRMKLHTLNGKTYLLVEKGGFIPTPAPKEDAEDAEDGSTPEATTDTDDGSASDTRPPGWHPGYEVYERTGS